MNLLSILKKFSIIIVAVLAYFLSRMGVGYLVILVAIGLFMPFLTNSKKGAVFTGILYATIGYLISYPSGLFLINYMPSIEIPISVSQTTVATDLFIGWLIPVLIAIIICGLFSIMGYAISKRLYGKNNSSKSDYHTFEEDIYVEKDEFDEDVDLINLSPIQRMKNKYKENDDDW